MGKILLLESEKSARLLPAPAAASMSPSLRRLEPRPSASVSQSCSSPSNRLALLREAPGIPANTNDYCRRHPNLRLRPSKDLVDLSFDTFVRGVLAAASVVHLGGWRSHSCNCVADWMDATKPRVTLRTCHTCPTVLVYVAASSRMTCADNISLPQHHLALFASLLYDGPSKCLDHLTPARRSRTSFLSA